VEGEKVARHLQRASFKHTNGSCLAEFEISWTDDFTSAYVTVPHLQLVCPARACVVLKLVLMAMDSRDAQTQEIRKQIPARVKTTWNLVFIFFFFLFGLVFRRPAPSQLLRVRPLSHTHAIALAPRLWWFTDDDVRRGCAHYCG
jgi:hypothetical protein